MQRTRSHVIFFLGYIKLSLASMAKHPLPLCVLRVFAFQTALPVLISPIVYGSLKTRSKRRILGTCHDAYDNQIRDHSKDITYKVDIGILDTVCNMFYRF